MPLYVFQCSKCNFEFEHIMSIEDGEKFSKVKGNCPKCGDPKSVSKIPTAGSFVINGYSEANGYSKQSTKRK